MASISQDHTIRIWDLSTGREIHKLDAGQSSYYDICFSPDGNVMASCGQSIRLWDAKTYQVIREFGNSSITKYGSTHCIAFSPDGKTLLAGCQDGGIHFWDPANGKEIRRVQAHKKGGKGVWSLAFSPGGMCLASAGGDGLLSLRKPATGEEIRRLFKGEPRPSSRLAFSPDSKLLAGPGMRIERSTCLKSRRAKKSNY